MDTITNCNRCSETERKVISKGGGYATASAGGDGTHSSPWGILDSHLLTAIVPATSRAGEDLCPSIHPIYEHHNNMRRERGRQ